jgi:hypothetical protein
MQSCEIEYTNEFGEWWMTLLEQQQEDIAAIVGLLADRGASLGFPHSSGINNSRHSHLRELRVQSAGRPIRIFYAFDPRRSAILLIRQVIIGSTRNTFPLPINCMMFI